MELKAILPKFNPLRGLASSRGALEKGMKELTADIQRESQTYEPPPSASYARTLRLFKSWSRSVKWSGNDLVGRVVSSGAVATDNRGRRYNVYVRGPRQGEKGRRQAAHMRARGWRSVDDIKDKYEDKARKRFQGLLLDLSSGHV